MQPIDRALGSIVVAISCGWVVTPLTEGERTRRNTLRYFNYSSRSRDVNSRGGPQVSLVLGYYTLHYSLQHVEGLGAHRAMCE